MKCSNLKAHLFELKLIDDPRCDCGYFYEDPIHFFFVCPRYANLRIALHNSLNPIVPFTLHSLLNGCDQISLDDNKNMYMTVMKYIENTKRFDS